MTISIELRIRSGHVGEFFDHHNAALLMLKAADTIERLEAQNLTLLDALRAAQGVINNPDAIAIVNAAIADVEEVTAP